MKVVHNKLATPAPQAHLTPSNWYVILKRATQLGYTNIWDFLDSMKK